ncbi:MAG: glycosyltransferase family 2 protein [Chloroflexi bacterium]|nr:glycosyltransferase family 2 protein [Chloroflexota bacterium]
MSKVAIVIPTWNGLKYLPTCLDAALRQTYHQYEVVLVDNGSRDGTYEFVTTHYPQVRVLRSERNLGFAAGTNLGIRNTHSEYVATLNNDTEAEPSWLEELVKVMDSDPSVGMCASKMLFYDQRQMINSAGIAVDRIGMAWDREGGKKDSNVNSEPYEVFGSCAGAALYRRAMLDEVGLFDEDFWAYLEDVDLAWRAQACGWRCLYVPSARVYHAYSATGRKDSPFKDYLLARNRLWMIIKNYPWPYWLAYSPLIVAYDVMAAVYRVTTTRRFHSLYGRWAALKSFPVALRKRRTVQSCPGYSARLAFACLSSLDSPMQVWSRFKYLKNLTLVER